MPIGLKTKHADWLKTKHADWLKTKHADWLKTKHADWLKTKQMMLNKYSSNNETDNFTFELHIKAAAICTFVSRQLPKQMWGSL